MTKLILIRNIMFSMSRFGEYPFQGLQFVRARFGERVYRFILRFGNRRANSKVETGRLMKIGKLVGLNAAETAAAAAASKAVITFPFWLKIILSGIAIAAGGMVIAYFVEANNVYLPGTLYASISPNDFLTYSQESILIT